jgi:hypothetical protein
MPSRKRGRTSMSSRLNSSAMSWNIAMYSSMPAACKRWQQHGSVRVKAA